MGGRGRRIDDRYDSDEEYGYNQRGNHGYGGGQQIGGGYYGN